jgi:hypothetical protein
MSAPDAVSVGFETLHLLRVRSLVPATDLGNVDELQAGSLILITPHGAMLTADGLARHEQLLTSWRSTVDLEALAASYTRFLAVNQAVKDICARWQTQGQDDEAIFIATEELSELVDRATPALRRAGRVVPRFDTYVPRLLSALNATREGDSRFITDPRVDSVHNIWFECHEDYLVTLDRDREHEGSY